MYYVLQEVLQAYFDEEFWGVERAGAHEPDISHEHHDGPAQMLLSSLPLPYGCIGMLATW